MVKRALRRMSGRLVKNGYAKLCFLFSAILLWQWYDSLEGYWWPETFAIVHALLIAGTAIELLVPGTFRWRLPLHALILPAAVMVYSDFSWEGWPDNRSDAAAWGDWFAEMTEPLMPYIGIAAAAYGIFLFAGRWCRSRQQVVLFCGAVLISLAVLDSFTRIYLWDEVAWCVFASLLWLVAEHFERFRRKHPDTWRHLTEYPISFGLPVAAVVGLVMAAGLLAPSVNPVFKDPYTLWMEARGQTVPSFVGDKVQSVSSAVRQRDSRSGYSRADDQLGDGFEFDYSEVMTVTTSRRSYWRGETKSEYTGQGWQDSEEELTEPAVSGLVPGNRLPAAANDAEAEAETETITAAFKMIREDAYPVLFGAHKPAVIHSINGEDIIPRALAWLPESGELRWPQTDSTPYPDTYIIESEQIALDEEKLRSAGPPSSDIADRYTRLPDMPERVIQLALELSAGLDNDYDKARRIEAYLKETYPYTNTPDVSKRTSEDFVDSFLFEIQEGYCDYFSTAMAVLARANGIPARWVKGYAPGALPPEMFLGAPEEVMMDPNIGGTYTVRNADAHSWVELYFEGFGWVPFEPTPGFAYPYSYPAGETPEPVLSDLGPIESAASESEVQGGLRVPRQAVIAAGILAAAAVLIWAFLQRRMLIRVWRRIRFGAMTANEQIVRETERLIRACRRRGLERSESETLRESVQRWSARRRSLAGDFQEVLVIFERAKYSGRQVTDEEARQFAAKIKLIRQRL